MKRAIDKYSVQITVNSAGGRSTDINLPGRVSLPSVMDMVQATVTHLHSASSFLVTIVHHVEYVEEEGASDANLNIFNRRQDG